MPWDYLLGGATGAGVCLVFILLFGQKLMESKINNVFEKKIEILKNDLLKDLEKSKSELNVWSELRNDVIKELWEVNKQIIQRMSAVIFGVQDLLFDKKDKHAAFKKLEGYIDDYRKYIHNNMHLVDMDKVLPITQEFLNTAFELISDEDEKKTNKDYEIKLKEIRNELQQYIVNHFGLQKVMPWMINEKV